jgi:cysteine-S-conjugate beta-lyase
MNMKLDTILGHCGRKPEENHGIVNPPVYHASTVIFPTVADLEKANTSPRGLIRYGLHGTPTTFAFEEAVAKLEGGEHTVSLPSGLAAIAVPLLAFLKAGDHLLVTDNTYSPTRRLCNGALAGFGVETTYFDPMIGAGIADLIRPETKVVFLESPGSNTFEVQDVPAIAKAAHAAGTLVMLDNTWSVGYYFKAFEHGVDISIQAATKFIVGHADAMLGTVTTTEEFIDTIKRTATGFGYCAGPDDCYLGLRGLRSLSPRLARHQENGLIVARWLGQRPEVKQVLHPALPGCPGHDIWKRDFTGSVGLFAAVLHDTSKASVAAMLDHMDLFAMGYSWGGYESLILPEDPAGARTVTSWPHTGPTLRLHIGLEDPQDLIDDLERGFERLKAAA